MRLLLLTIYLFSSFSLLAVRPFITDDARVVGKYLAQWESWLRFEKHSGQQWHMAAYGPSDKWELTLGAVMGYANVNAEKNEFSYALPLLQAKYLVKEYGYKKGPGIAFVGGTFLPMGRGSFVPQTYGAFSFVNFTQCFGKNEDVLIHANAGISYLFTSNKNWVNTLGLGTQIRTYKGLHVLGEVFSGDPYIPGAGLAYQAGVRHFVSDYLQFDATFGKGISGIEKLPFWSSVGVRVVSSYFLRKKQ